MNGMQSIASDPFNFRGFSSASHFLHLISRMNVPERGRKRGMGEKIRKFGMLCEDWHERLIFDGDRTYQITSSTPGHKKGNVYWLWSRQGSTSKDNFTGFMLILYVWTGWAHNTKIQSSHKHKTKLLPARWLLKTHCLPWIRLYLIRLK